MGAISQILCKPIFAKQILDFYLYLSDFAIGGAFGAGMCFKTHYQKEYFDDILTFLLVLGNVL